MENIELGAVIAVDGMPDWLDREQMVLGQWRGDTWYKELTWKHCYAFPDDITAIRLPADHWAYPVIAKGFEPWAGGDDAPVDWDGGEVLLRNEEEVAGPAKYGRWYWADYSQHGFPMGQVTDDIIGYRRKAEPNAETVAAIDEIRARGFDGFESVGDLMDDLNDQVKIAKITRSEAYEDGLDIATLERLGLLKEETLLERFEREFGGLDNIQRDIVAAYQEWIAAQ